MAAPHGSLSPGRTQPPFQVLGTTLIENLKPSLRYLMQTEVHVYAFSIAANVLLSFIPFLLVMLSIFRHVFHWQAGVDAINITLRDFLPNTKMGEYIFRNAGVLSSHRFEWVSILMLLFTSNGIFEPLEVALNRAWGVTKNRSYLKNQLVSLGLIFATGFLALLSTALTALNSEFLTNVQQNHGGFLIMFFTMAWFKMAAVPVSILMLFLVYWLLPNRKVPPLQIAAVAIIVGLLLEVLKYINLLIWPWLERKLEREVVPFQYSVTIILWSFFAAMLVLAGAEWSARHARSQELAERR